MIKEAYCSYEVAKLLKEKGFPISEYSGIYTNKDNLCLTDVGMMFHLSKEDYIHFEDFFIPTITHQMAMAWLREVHHYYIQIMLDSWACGGHLGYYVVIQKTDSDFEMMLQDAVDNVFYQTYEEAVEAALKYVLENLI